MSLAMSMSGFLKTGNEKSSNTNPRAIKILGAALLMMASTWFAVPSLHAAANESDGDAGLQQQVESLKQSVLELNRDMLILEEELLFPASTQVSFFLSMDVGEFFQLQAVKLKIDDKLVASHLYTEQQTDALFRGGVQRLYLGNLKSGSHEIAAFFTGIGPQGREYKRAASLTLEKDNSSKVLELRIIDSTARLQPLFDIKEWQAL